MQVCQCNSGAWAWPLLHGFFSACPSMCICATLCLCLSYLFPYSFIQRSWDYVWGTMINGHHFLPTQSSVYWGIQIIATQNNKCFNGNRISSSGHLEHGLDQSGWEEEVTFKLPVYIQPFIQNYLLWTWLVLSTSLVFILISTSWHWMEMLASAVRQEKK